jgi:GntP family gluconate:H+ symporter
MHGLVPPHPGPLTAIDYLGADLGTTLALGVAVAIPTVIIAGPVFGLVGRYVTVEVPHRFEATDEDDATVRPSFPVTLASVLLPVFLMMGKALADIFIDDETAPLRSALDVIGTPLIALLIAVVVGMFTLGHGMGRDGVAKSIESSLPGVAGILLIVAAGGGFKQSLVDTGIGTLVAEKVADSNISVLVLAWFVAVLIRLATGSATVATVTASGLLAPLTAQLSSGEVSLMVLAIGAGSVFFSHVNDAGFWLVKEYFGMTVGQTFKTWSAMETLLSVSGLAFVMVLNAFI